ncbi:soluble lytic murein transglycosylase [Rhodovulum imhoffii]|uniref:Soluble lytic murein transglycosylase n=1 Tax=Rhodovulum imhoffii TaxID=365340 RepID=A0A2T5BU69_9RHOB|nr:lytic transglycosylase domain-containing protein [Rhodovulum imhoffii]PTN03022.1 soluble lytic murein transglycosylase [Rhodovulum imhoffii]
MFARIVACFPMMLALLAGPATADLAQVMAAVRADKWAEARTLAGQTGPEAEALVEWRALRAGEGDFAACRDFLARHADWPGLDRIRADAEQKMPPDLPAARVLEFFANARPLTGAGALRLAQAQGAQGLEGDAQAEAVLAWRTLPMGPDTQADFLRLFSDLLASHHIARLDAMLWQGKRASALNMLPLVPEGWRSLARARLALRDMAPGVDVLIGAVPPELERDPGLAFERFQWRARKGRNDEAIAILAMQSDRIDGLGRAQSWGNWRRIFARVEAREGRPERAYALAARHGLVEGSDYADLEWLAGFIALRLLEEPQTALGHFGNFAAAVETPISLGRAGYWQGRALEALGRPEEARAAYAQGAAHQTSFYGQLAAERAGLPMDPALAATGPLPGVPDLKARPVVKTALALHAAGERNLAEVFFTHIAENLRATDQAGLAALALSLPDEHIALRVAKVAAGQGVVLPQAYFPLPDIAAPEGVPKELVLSIARRESEFDPAVTSPAGARGLMQLMPATARDMALRLGTVYRPAALTRDAAYNARLGGAYLAYLRETFGTNPVLTTIGYNAGPSRVTAWIEGRGDPREAGVDVIDWIEMIPFRETRNYVMRVTESMAIYRARLSGKTQPMRLSRDLKAR